MTRTVIWSIAILCIFVTKSRAQNSFSGGFIGGTDYYKQCATELGISSDVFGQQNRTNMLCLQKCVFEKDGTLDKGVIMKSMVVEYLFNTLFGNDNHKIGFFNQCISNLMPLGIVKNCWDIDKFVYCLVSNAESFVGENQYMPPPDMPMSQMNGGMFPGRWIPAPAGPVSPVMAMGLGGSGRPVATGMPARPMRPII